MLVDRLTRCRLSHPLLNTTCETRAAWLARLPLAMLVCRASIANEMTTKSALGETEHHVLLAAVRLGGEADTVGIVHELETQTGRRVAPAAVYIALRRLEAHRLVRSKLVTRRGESRTRRHFDVTPAGRAVLRASRERLLILWSGLDLLWKES
jgi:DNA-binding MarR family transcriptional regulator